MAALTLCLWCRCTSGLTQLSSGASGLFVLSTLPARLYLELSHHYQQLELDVTYTYTCTHVLSTSRPLSSSVGMSWVSPGSKGSVASLDTIPTGWLTAVSVLDGLAESHHLQYNFVGFRDSWFGKLCWRTRAVVRWSNFHISIFWCGLGWCQGPNESPAGTTGSCDSNHVTRQLANPRGPHKFPSISLSKLRSVTWYCSMWSCPLCLVHSPTYI